MASNFSTIGETEVWRGAFTLTLFRLPIYPPIFYMVTQSLFLFVGTLLAVQLAYADNAATKLWSDRVRENFQGLSPIQQETVLRDAVYSIARMGEYNAAHEFSRDVSAPKFLPELLIIIAVQQALAGDIGKIASTIERIAEKPERDNAWHQVIQSLLEDGRIHDAEGLFGHVRGLPGFDVALTHLAVAQTLSGDEKGANVTLEKIESAEWRMRARDAVRWASDADVRTKRLERGFIQEQIEMLAIGLDGVFDREVDALLAVQLGETVDLDLQAKSLLPNEEAGKHEVDERTMSKICLLAIAWHKSGSPDKAEELLRTAKKSTDRTWRNLTTGFARSIQSYLMVELKMDSEVEQMLQEVRLDAPADNEGQFQFYDGTIEGIGVASAMRSTHDAEVFYGKCRVGYERCVFAANMLSGIAYLPR